MSLLLVRDNGNSKIDTEPDDIDNNDDEVFRRFRRRESRRGRGWTVWLKF